MRGRGRKGEETEERKDRASLLVVERRILPKCAEKGVGSFGAGKVGLGASKYCRVKRKEGIVLPLSWIAVERAAETWKVLRDSRFQLGIGMNMA